MSEEKRKKKKMTQNQTRQRVKASRKAQLQIVVKGLPNGKKRQEKRVFVRGVWPNHSQKIQGEVQKRFAIEKGEETENIKAQLSKPKKK